MSYIGELGESSTIFIFGIGLLLVVTLFLGYLGKILSPQSFMKISMEAVSKIALDTVIRSFNPFAGGR